MDPASTSTLTSTFGKWLSGKLLNYAWDSVASLFRQPKMIEAFEKACIKVVKEESHLLNQYSVTAFGPPDGAPDEESLWFKLEQSFDANSFPDVESLTQMLVESWKARKRWLDPSVASEFFSLSEEMVKPIIQKISENFFRELAQIPELAMPFIIQELQRLPHFVQENFPNSPTQPLITLENLKSAFHNASFSLLNWPTTLGNQTWLERSELQTFLDRINANENSTTILLGPPGSGKSALLSVLACKLKEKKFPVLAIKADQLPPTIDSLEKLSNYLNLPITADACLRRLATEQKAVLIIDQLDALSEIVDRKSERLNILLSLIRSVSSLKNIHVVSSSRWFEFRHDTRLNTIQAEHLELTSLQWEKVQTMLTRFGVSDQNWSEEAQSMLRIPLHLKIFLDLRNNETSVEVLRSLQGLLEELWQQKVLKEDGATDRNTLVHELARQMSEDEELWISRAFADSYPEALKELIRQDILNLSEDKLKIGFRHQTYFDFARARYFAQRKEVLSQYIIDRQDGLFIRPILLRSLEYLRGSDIPNYHRELSALWNYSGLRFHLKYLLVEFLASLEKPDRIEIACLIPILRDESQRHRALLAMAGSHGWFMVVKESILTEIMSSPPDMAISCISLLIQALPFDRISVINIIQSCWLRDIKYDSLTLNVMQYLKVWDEDSAEMICSVARRSADWNISYIADIVSQCNPELAPRIVRADLDRRLSEAEHKDPESYLMHRLNIDENSYSSDGHSIVKDYRDNLKKLLEGYHGSEWEELSLIAESDPDAFLDQVWPWFIYVLERITRDPDLFTVCYRNDYCLGTQIDRSHSEETQPAAAINVAIIKLAESDPTAFLAFFKKNETSDLLSVHRFLCKGLARLASNYPEVIFKYLTEDPRRFMIGDYENCHRDSCTLISCIAPFLNMSDLAILEETVLEWSGYYCTKESLTPEDRRQRLKWNREHRLRLLRAFPDGSLSENAKVIYHQEERAFPGFPDWDSRIDAVRNVGSPMTAEQMHKAKDSDILKCCKELVDSTGWDHPRSQKFGKSVGGAIQISRELEKFAEQEPKRASDLVNHFEPGEHELHVGAILEGIAKSSFPSEALFQLITDSDSSGFSGNNFRISVANALKMRSEKDNGLPDSMLTLMESWLTYHPEPQPERIENIEEKQVDYSLIWGMGGFSSFPGGRDLVFDSVAIGYLFREPQDVQGWAKVIERALEYENHPDVWQFILRRMPELYNGDRVVATNLYDQVLTRFTHARESTMAVKSVVDILPWVKDIEIIHKWLNFYRNGEWKAGYQAFGEMLMWHLFHNPSDTWAQEAFTDSIKNPDGIDVKRGIAFAAAYNWGHPICQELCTSALVSLSIYDDKDLCKAIAIVFSGSEALYLNDNMQSIIEAVLLNDQLIMASAINLIEGIEEATDTNPELVFKICDRFLDVGSEEIKSIATQYGHLADPLVKIAITLHRMSSPHRESGLMLFEKLSESNIQQARQALDELDRRPIRRQSSRLPSRRRKRRRRTQIKDTLPVS